GKNRAGTPDLLAAEGARRNFAVDIVPAVETAGKRISSGMIREALAAGHVATANELLGYPWFVSGEVVHGDKRGRELGYPTANLRLDPSCRLRHGIYAVRVGVGEHRYDGVASFGRRPMFDVGTVLLEVFLFEFSGDLYGRMIDVAFIDWIRPELTFDSVENLVRRMDEDSRLARIAVARAGLVSPFSAQKTKTRPPGGALRLRRPRRLRRSRPPPPPRRARASRPIPWPAQRRSRRRRTAERSGASRWRARPAGRPR